MVENNFDILCVAETKLDSSFPKAQFSVNGYKTPFRLDVTDTSGGLLIYVKTGLPSVPLKEFSIPKDVQILPFEIQLKSCKWLVVAIYKPPSQDAAYFLSCLSDLLDFYHYDRSIIIGDFNLEPENSLLSSFLDSHVLHNHVDFKTCFKSLEGSCIDLILSNRKHCLRAFLILALVIFIYWCTLF